MLVSVPCSSMQLFPLEGHSCRCGGECQLQRGLGASGALLSDETPPCGSGAVHPTQSLVRATACSNACAAALIAILTCAGSFVAPLCWRLHAAG